MSNFSANAIELKYDFTGFPKNDGSKGKCTGKGVIPEPTQKDLQRYQEAMKELFQVEEDGIDLGQEALEAQDTEALEEKLDKLLGLTAELCKHSPSVEDLRELPPRIQLAFQKHIYKELADPEV